MGESHYQRLHRHIAGWPRWARLVAGILLVLCGLLGFLPILGFWMVPLGLLVLSIDVAVVRRLRRRLELWWARRREDRRPKLQEPAQADPGRPSGSCQGGSHERQGPGG